MVKKASTEGKEKKAKKKEGEDKPKKEKKKKEKRQLDIHSNKANPRADIDPRTGTRFSPGSARQQAFDIIFELASDGKNAKEIRAALKSARKDAGNKYNLDPGYLHYVIAMHPEMFEAYSDGEVKVISKPKIDKEAAKRMEEEAKKKKKRAEDARDDRKKKKKPSKKKEPEVKE